MNSMLICYQNVTEQYVKDIIDILSYHNFILAPQDIIDDETITRAYIFVKDENVFKPKFSAEAILDDITRLEYPKIRYITNKVTYTDNYVWRPYFTRCDDNLNVVKSCDKCQYCVDEISVSRFICTKANKEIGYASQQEFPEWCPLTDGWRTYEEFKILWKDYYESNICRKLL